MNRRAVNLPVRALRHFAFPQTPKERAVPRGWNWAKTHAQAIDPDEKPKRARTRRELRQLREAEEVTRETQRRLKRAAKGE